MTLKIKLVTKKCQISNKMLINLSHKNGKYFITRFKCKLSDKDKLCAAKISSSTEFKYLYVEGVITIMEHIH